MGTNALTIAGFPAGAYLGAQVCVWVQNQNIPFDPGTWLTRVSQWQHWPSWEGQYFEGTSGVVEQGPGAQSLHSVHKPSRLCQKVQLNPAPDTSCQPDSQIVAVPWQNPDPLYRHVFVGAMQTPRAAPAATSAAATDAISSLRSIRVPPFD
jgi:hypothetical protein